MRTLFFIVLLIALPVLFIYRLGDGIDWNFAVKSTFGEFSIANLGMDNIQCTMIPFILDKWELTCPYGKMDHL